MAIIKCPNCGHVASDKADRCPNCGVSLRQPVNQFPNQQSYQPNNGYQQQYYQPQPNYYRPQVCPKTWMTESILVTLFCCLPFGIAGIINASKVSSKFAAGLYDEAQMASKNAGRYTSIGFWISIICFVIYVIIMLILALSTSV